jgi:hypothetical protein
MTKKVDAGLGAAASPGTTIIVGRVIIDPEPENGENGFFNSAYDGHIRIFLDNVLKNSGNHDDEFWREWPVSIEGIENYVFYYGVSNTRYYAVMLGYMLSRNGDYELIKFPVTFTLDIQPGDRAIYIGTIKVTRDIFYGIKKIEIYDEYNRILP